MSCSNVGMLLSKAKQRLLGVFYLSCCLPELFKCPGPLQGRGDNSKCPCVLYCHAECQQISLTLAVAACEGDVSPFSTT